MVTEVQR